MKKLLNYIITSAFGLFVAAMILVGLGTFTQTSKSVIFGDLADAFFVPGVVILGIGLLLFASNGGAFDMLRYSVIKLFTLFRRDLTKVKYRTFYDYRKAQSEHKRSFLYMLVVGAVFLVLAVVFFILYRTAS